MTVGVCYFPEHWPRERWATDVEQMAEAGIEYVRMGEFAWSRIEPEPGDVRLDWLEAAVDLVHERGLLVVLCTPTATPPKWLVDRHPGILQAEPDGTRREFGGRRHYCFDSPTYREETERIVTAVAERFADHRTGGAAGRPAITRAERGDGRVDYVGVWPSTGLARALVSDLLADAGVRYTPVLPEGVRLCRRGDLTWVTNFAPIPVQVHATDAEWVVGDGTVQGYGASVVTAPPHEQTVERTG